MKNKERDRAEKKTKNKNNNKKKKNQNQKRGANDTEQRDKATDETTRKMHTQISHICL